MTSEPAFRFADLFAGIGGFAAALNAFGGKGVYSVEIDAAAAKVYELNWGHSPLGDITKDATDTVMNVPAHDVLAAGFPCQPFSIAGVSKKNALGRAHGFACEAQGTLFFDVARII